MHLLPATTGGDATGATGAGESRPNSMEKSERLKMGLLSVPGITLTLFTLVIPMLWLFWLSFVNESGALSGENYARMLEPLYLLTFWTTFKVAALVTALAVLMGYPLSYMLAQLPPKASAICMVFVILPFWTSVLVRTYAWLVILQRKGIINTWLINSGILSEPLSLVNNLTGTMIGMTHVMVPCLVFPLYSAMKSIDPALMRAASNCGASPSKAFWQVFFPLTLPGLSSGVVLVFTLSLGYFITPALLGGGKVVMWAMQIESNISLYANWGSASALGVALVLVTFGILYLINRVMGVNPYESK
jgi:putative spermidine/putrescine transport system permease protein